MISILGSGNPIVSNVKEESELGKIVDKVGVELIQKIKLDLSKH